MAPPKRKTGGRVTPKGTRPGELPTASAPTLRGGGDSEESQVQRASSASKRYTPPAQKIHMPSPTWVPVLMFALWIIGALIIILNYIQHFLPGVPNNLYLLVGLAMILAGLFVATQYR
jgi:Cell division protein CrgA